MKADYEKKYKEALEWMRSLYDGLHGATKEDAEHYFPELKESEDERIRKELIEFLQLPHPQFVGKREHLKYINWLEKQGELNKNATKDRVVKYLSNLISDQALRGVPMLYYEGRIEEEADFIIRLAKNELEKERQGEQKTNPYSGVSFEHNGHVWGMCARDNGVDILLDRLLFRHLEEQSEQNPTDEVKSKFKIGDWVVFLNKPGSIYQIKKVGNYQYTLRHILGGSMDLSFSHENDIRLWTIDDAKDGNVLFSGGVIFIFNKIHDVWISCHCSLHKDNSFIDEDYNLMHIKYSKEVYPATKEQRDLLFQKMKEAGYEWDAENKELKKIEPENYKQQLMSEMTDLVKHEFTWSEEDEKIFEELNSLIDTLFCKGGISSNLYKKYHNWLKSLRPQNNWKPNDDQLKAFEHFVESIGESGFSSPYESNIKLLYSLLSDLKKLKEE